jgi:phage terminase large subunit-like protein
MAVTICPEISTSSVESLRSALKNLCEAGLTDQYLQQETLLTALRLDADFATFAHPHQEPRHDILWATWLIIGGRGSGKTRAGAEWVRGLVHGVSPYAERPHSNIALVGESEHDIREVMVEGNSGLLRISPRFERPIWIASRRRLEWPNGAVAQAFSAEDPESLRGPQFEAAWCDELCKWRYAQATFDALQFGLRLGPRPLQLITTTPRPIPLLKRLIGETNTVVTRAPTSANKDYLSPVFLHTVVGRYAGTRLGRQEIDGEIVEDRSDALWSRTVIENCRVSDCPQLARIVVGIDPPGSSRPGADACGIVAAGRAEDGEIYVLEDASMAGLSPAAWATKAVALYRRLQANTVVIEINMGGEMARAVLRQVDALLPIQEVHATRGKWIRAEPVAALYAQNRVKHVGCFAMLEDQMCDFGYDGLSSGRSPDRLDALVWAVTALISGVGHGPRIRVL